MVRSPGDYCRTALPISINIRGWNPVNPHPSLDDPFYEDGPSGETLLEAIKDLSPTDIAEMVNQGAARVLTRAKPRLEFETPVMLSIDITYVAFYGEREELVRVQGVVFSLEHCASERSSATNFRLFPVRRG